LSLIAQKKEGSAVAGEPSFFSEYYQLIQLANRPVSLLFPTPRGGEQESLIFSSSSSWLSSWPAPS
jgi:hypothetical protein